MGRPSACLKSKLYRAFKALAYAGFEQYGIGKADLADQAKSKRSKLDLVYERAGVQKRSAGDALVGKSRTQVRRFVENVLSRPSSPESARIVIWRIVNCVKACAWRSSSNGSDPWFDKVLDLASRGVPYVRERPASSGHGPVYAFIHPKGVSSFVNQTLDDVASWLPKRSRAAIEKAMIRSIQARATGRAEAFAHWVGQSAAYVDVRVYEGPWRKSVSDPAVDIRAIHYHRVGLFKERQPLNSNEREPKIEEQIQAFITDAFDDSGQPGSIAVFVLPTLHATTVKVHEAFTE